MKSTIHSTIVISSILAFVLISVVGLLSLTSQFENVAQGQEGGGPEQQGENQLIEDPQQSANQTMERAIQSAKETGEDVAEVGSQVTEGAKDLIRNIGDKLADLGK
jgi:predicted PurR-regulated permease PerM